MKLGAYLEAKNISVRDFAKLIEVSPEAVRLYLAGQRRPRDGKMQAITAATEGAVTANDFYGAATAQAAMGSAA